MQTAEHFDRPMEPLIDDVKIYGTLKCCLAADDRWISDILAKARELKGLDLPEIACLLHAATPDALAAIHETARFVKESIYGNRLVLFAPLYISNYCINRCLYCSFRADNRKLRRIALTQEEIAQEVRELVGTGQKRILLVAAENPKHQGQNYLFEAIQTIYGVHERNGEIRRLNVNVAPMSVDDFRALKACGIGTYQLFQETYHRPTYRQVHPAGPKADYDWRITAMDRAFQAGIDDVGIGVLFGLYDFRYEVLALIEHIRHLETRFGVGCHTISVPRIEPAQGAFLAGHPPYPVSDEEFKKIVAVLRLAVPYTGIIMSTRETPEVRAETFALGVSQISAGSRTSPGGYGHSARKKTPAAQFQLGDHRNLEEVIRDVVARGFIPSFCTACYRLGRTGGDFMDLAKPGLIKRFCLPNALLTFKEYLEDYAEPETREAGLALIAQNLEEIPTEIRRKETEERLDQIEQGERDLYF